MPRGSVPEGVAAAHQLHGLAVRLADVQLHRHIHLQRQIKLPLKHLALFFARGEVVVVVQPNLAQHFAFGKCPKPAQRPFHIVRPVAGVVRVYAGGEAETGVLPHDLKGALVVWLIVAGVADHHAGGNARRAHARKHLGKVSREALRGDVGVGIEQTHTILQKRRAGVVFPRGACVSRSPRRGRSPRPRR